MEYVANSGSAAPEKHEGEEIALTSELTPRSIVKPEACAQFPSANATATPCGGEEEYPQLCRLYVLGRALDGVAVLGGKLGDELQQGGALVLHRLPVAAQQGLVLSRQHVDPRLQLREAVPDVVHQQPGAGGGKRR